MKIKFNWGTGIVLAIISFMSFILYLVITMTSDKNFNHDLVIEEYYKQELTFQDQLDRTANSRNLEQNISIEITAGGLVITFPPEMDVRAITGDILVYRPSDKELDFHIPIELAAHSMVIPERHLESGRWNIEINWEYKEESYYFKQDVTF